MTVDSEKLTVCVCVARLLCLRY